MRLPFFRAKSPAGGPPKPERRARGKSAASPAAVEAAPVAEARTRARRRLIGALVLLVVGVVGFPMLFESQPRPLPVDTPILLPQGSAARVGAAATSPSAPGPRPAPAPAPAPDAGTETVGVQAAAAEASAAQRPAPVTPAAASAPAPVAGLARPAVSKPEPVKPEAVKPEPVKAEAVTTEPVKAEAVRPDLPKPAPPRAEPAKAPPVAPDAAPATGGRFVVQVGAFTDAERLRAVRQKLEKQGFKTYTQEIQTAAGKSTRVRIGPYANRQEADAVANKIKAGGLQVNILAL